MASKMARADYGPLSTGSLSFIWSQYENLAFISSVVDCVSVNPSARLNHVLRDAQKVCALTIVGTVLKAALTDPPHSFKLSDKIHLAQKRENAK